MELKNTWISFCQAIEVCFYLRGRIVPEKDVPSKTRSLILDSLRLSEVSSYSVSHSRIRPWISSNHHRDFFLLLDSFSSISVFFPLIWMRSSRSKYVVSSIWKRLDDSEPITTMFVSIGSIEWGTKNRANENFSATITLHNQWLCQHRATEIRLMPCIEDVSITCLAMKQLQYECLSVRHLPVILSALMNAKWIVPRIDTIEERDALRLSVHLKLRDYCQHYRYG